MGLFDKLIRKNRNTGSTSNGGSSFVTPIRFYSDCVEDYHAEAQKWDLAKRGLIFIPELIPMGERAILAYLQDPGYARAYPDPKEYYQAIMTFSIQMGIVFAAKWHSNFDELKRDYVDKIILVEPTDDCEPYIAMLGLDEGEKEEAFYSAIFGRFIVKHEPYWKLRDPRQYTFKALLAAYQLGVSMVLEKLGY